MTDNRSVVVLGQGGKQEVGGRDSQGKNFLGVRDVLLVVMV